MASLLYVERWTAFRAAGGVRLAFLGLPPVSAEDDDNLIDGTDGATFTWPRSYPPAQAFTRGESLQYIFDDGTRIEKEVEDVAIATGPAEPLISIRCVGPGARLLRLSCEDVDGDGVRYQDIPLAQLTPAIAAARILSLAPPAPSWFTLGTVSSSDLVELQLSGDSKLSALLKLATKAGLELAFRFPSPSAIAIDLVVRGASAPVLRLRSGQNLESFGKAISGDQVTLARGQGGQGDDGASSLAWAFWAVTNVVGNDVTLGPIHGSGPGPIAFANQGTDFRTPNLIANPDPSAATQVGTPVITRNAVAGGGYTLHLIADNDGAGFEYLRWPVTIPNVGSAAAGVVAVGFVVRKGTSHVSSDFLQVTDGDVSDVGRLSLSVAWDGAGVPTVTPATGTFLAATHLGDGVYFITGLTTGLIPTNNNRVRVIPSGSAAADQGNIYYADAVLLNQNTAPARREPWYLQKDDGTVAQVLATTTAGVVTLAYVTGVATGDWVRFVANGQKHQLTYLEAPNRLPYGDRPGVSESEWTDAVNILENPTWRVYTNPSARPDGWGGAAGTATQRTAAGEWLTVGSSVQIVYSGSGSPAVLLSRARSWFLHPRRSILSASSWFRILAMTNGQVGIRITRAGVVIGETATYRSPINVWRQLKIAGLGRAADEGTTVSYGLEFVAVPDPGLTMTLTVLVDSMMLGPSADVRPMLEGAGPARIWQGTNDWLAEVQGLPTQYRFSALDLQRAGIDRVAAIEVGQSALVDETQLGLATQLPARITRRRRDLRRPLLTQLEASTAPQSLKRELARYSTIEPPFFEPIEVRQPATDTRQAVQTLKATITSQTASQITVSLTHSDLKGGTPALSYELSASVSYVSGSGLGPYVFNKPSAGAGVGRVIFTSTIPGRSNVTDAVDVPENSSPAVEMKAIQLSKTANQIIVRVSTATGGAGGASVTVTYDAGGLSISPASGGTTSSMVAITSIPSGAQYIEYTITRPDWGTGGARVQFMGAATGFQAGTTSVDVPAKERPQLLLRASLQTINPTTVVVRVAVADPFPPGGASVTVTYAANPAGGVTPASGGTLTPTADIGTTGTIDYTIDRPAAGASVKRVTFTAADSTNNRAQTSDAIDVEPQEPPSFDATSLEQSTTQWKITWTAVGTVEVSKNGGAYGTPAAAGLTSGTAFNRPAYGAADDVYAFRITNGGSTLGDTFYVPSTKVLTGVSVSITSTFGVDASPGPQKIDITFSGSGVPSGTTYDLEYELFDSSNVYKGAFGYHAGVTSVFTINPSPAFVETDKLKVTVYAYHQGLLIATKTRYATCTF